MTENNDVDAETEQQQSNNGDDYPSLEDLVRRYLDARGKDNVAQVTVGEDGFKHGTLIVTAHTAIYDELPDIVAETDIITHQGYQYGLIFEEDPYGPSTLGRITLYAADTIRGMDAVTLENGLAEAEDYMQNLIDDEEELPRPPLAE